MTVRTGSFIRSVSRKPATFTPYPAVASDEAEALGTWLKALTVEPVSAVEWFCPEGWAIRERAVSDDMAFCAVSGTYAGCARTLADECPMVPGDILLIPRGVAHWIRRIEGDCRMVSLHMHTRVYGAIDALSHIPSVHIP